MYFVGEVVRPNADRNLALAVGLLVNRRCDGALLEVGRHFPEQGRGYHLYFSSHAPRPNRVAHRQTIYRVYVDPGKPRDTAQKVESFLEAFIFIFVRFNDAHDLPASAVPRERFRKAIGFLAMILGSEHARNDRNPRASRNELAHQFTGKTAIQ